MTINRLDDDQARALFKDTLANQQSFLHLAAMDAGVSRTTCCRCAYRRYAWVTKFVAEKVEDVILDVGKIDHVLTDGMIHYHMMRSCHNTRPAFLARNTPMPLISDIYLVAWMQLFLSPCAPKALVVLTQIGHMSCDPSLT